MSLNKIPLSNEKSFMVWKTKAMVFLETMDYHMLEIIQRVIIF